jgi:hypothetical protein
MRSCGCSSSSSRLAGREAEPQADKALEELAEAIASSGPTPCQTSPVPDLWWMPDLSRPCGRAVLIGLSAEPMRGSLFARPRIRAVG